MFVSFSSLRAQDTFLLLKGLDPFLLEGSGLLIALMFAPASKAMGFRPEGLLCHPEMGVQPQRAAQLLPLCPAGGGMAGNAEGQRRKKRKVGGTAWATE